MSRINGPIPVWSRADTPPTDREGGYAGGDATAAAFSTLSASVDAVATEVADLDIGVAAVSATTSGGVTTIEWAGGTAGTGGDTGGGGSTAWSSVTGKPASFPPSTHSHPVTELQAAGTPNDRRYLRGDGAWDTPGNGAVASGGCLRLYADGIAVHYNVAHVNNAITGFGEDGTGAVPYDAQGRLIIKHATAGPIIGMSASPDESLVLIGVTAGLSGGSGTTVVQFVKNGSPVDLRDPAQYASIAGPYNNLWLTWINWGPSAGKSTIVQGGA